MANTGARSYIQRRKGPPVQRTGFDLAAMLNQPCPKHGTDQKPATHSWKDCSIMRSFRESIQRQHGPNGGSGSGSHGPGHGSGGSSSGFQGHNNQGDYNQQSNQGNQQQQWSGYQSNPKQLNGGQYHVFTTSLCKRDQKLHKRAVNSVEPAVPRYLRWSEQPIV